MLPSHYDRSFPLVLHSSSKTDPVTGKANVIPSVVITPEAGKPAKVDLFNIFVGKVSWVCGDCSLQLFTVMVFALATLHFMNLQRFQPSL